jgi:hypothetical protein
VDRINRALDWLERRPTWLLWALAVAQVTGMVALAVIMGSS